MIVSVVNVSGCVENARKCVESMNGREVIYAPGKSSAPTHPYPSAAAAHTPAGRLEPLPREGTMKSSPMGGGFILGLISDVHAYLAGRRRKVPSAQRRPVQRTKKKQVGQL